MVVAGEVHIAKRDVCMCVFGVRPRRRRPTIALPCSAQGGPGDAASSAAAAAGPGSGGAGCG